MRAVRADFELHAGDLRPPFRTTLDDGEGNVLNLTTADSVTFAMRSTLDDSLKVDDAAAILVEPRTSGIVEYRWSAGDTDTPGDYVATVRVTWDDGRPETFPNQGEHLVRIHDETGRDA